MGRIGESLLDFFYPLRSSCLGCGDEYGCDEPFLCNDCLALLNPAYVSVSHPDWLKRGLSSVRFVYYYGQPVSGLVRALKFHYVRALAAPMAQDMSDLLEEKSVSRIDIIVPVPLHPSRFYRRGFNQSELLANELSKLCGIPVEKNVLLRKRKTRQQSKLSHKKRGRNVENAFRAAGRLDGKRILILDDVITTGNTVSACAEALRAAGAEEVHAIAYAGSHSCNKSLSGKKYRRGNNAQGVLREKNRKIVYF